MRDDGPLFGCVRLRSFVLHRHSLLLVETLLKSKALLTDSTACGVSTLRIVKVLSFIAGECSHYNAVIHAAQLWLAGCTYGYMAG